MNGTTTQLTQALKPLGDCKSNYNGLKYNCPKCEKTGALIDKFNLEVSLKKNVFHCWACNYKGTLWKLIKDYGFKEFLHLFVTVHAPEEQEEEKKIFEIPQYIVNVLNNKEATDYLLSRGLTKDKIREREIKFCYAGVFKDAIIFPSYSLKGELTAFVIHWFKQKRYSVRKNDNFVSFYECFIDKRAPIILTEGVYDALVVPNAIPLLGTVPSKKLQTFLSNTEVVYVPDTDVKKTLQKQIIKDLRSVCQTVHRCRLLSVYKDINELYCKNRVVLVQELKQFYLTSKELIHDRQT
jgi:DNA primase